MKMRFLLSGSFILIGIFVSSCYRLGDPAEAEEEFFPSGKEVFNESIVHSIELSLSEDDWQAIIDEAEAYENINPDRPYYRALLRFDGVGLNDDIGIRLKGHISIDLSKGHSFPLKLDFNRYDENQTLDGLKKLNLNNNFNGPPLTIVRDFLSYKAWREFGVAASRTSFAHVTVNQEYLGFYALVEQVDGDFIERHFNEPYGDLYKPEQISGTLEYRGPSIADYPDIGHKWPDESNHSSLLHALEVLNSGQPGEIAMVFDVESVLTYLAGNVALGSADFYPNTGHNYYLYEALPGRFHMLPWDMNGSQEAMGPALCSPISGLLSKKLLEDPVYEARYLEILSEFFNTAGSADQLSACLDGARKLLGSEFPGEEFEGLRQDIISRADWLTSQLASTSGCVNREPE